MGVLLDLQQGPCTRGYCHIYNTIMQISQFKHLKWYNTLKNLNFNPNQYIFNVSIRNLQKMLKDQKH